MFGLLEDDTDRLSEGIDLLLERHEDAIDEGDLRDVEKLVLCLEATCYTTLARRDGLEFDPESEFVPMEFVEHLSS